MSLNIFSAVGADDKFIYYWSDLSTQAGGTRSTGGINRDLTPTRTMEDKTWASTLDTHITDPFKYQYCFFTVFEVCVLCVVDKPENPLDFILFHHLYVFS